MTSSLPRVLLLCGAVAGSGLTYHKYSYRERTSIQSKLDAVETAFRRGIPLGSPQEAEHLCGRVMRIGRSGYPKLMAGNIWKPYAFVVGGDGLYEISQCRSDFDKLMLLGFEEKWVKLKLENNDTYFALTIFPECSDKYKCEQATWDGVFKLIEETQPKVFQRIGKYRDEITRRSCADIEAECDWDFLTVNENKTHPMNLNAEKLLAMDPEDITVAHARMLLYSWALNHHFKGDGYTVDKNGNIGTKEYLMTNVKMTDVDDMRKIKLNVVVPVSDSVIT